MHELIAWCGFAGGWLLVAGPIFQAAIELTEQEIARDEIDAAARAVGPTRRISAWWWLIPPVGYIQQRRQARRQRQAMLAALAPEHLEQLVRFMDKATGWLFVAGGAALIATKETWELHEAYHWPTAVFWVLTPLALLLCGVNTAVRMKRSRHLPGHPGPA